MGHRAREFVRSGRVRKRYIALVIVLLIVGFVGWRVYAIATAGPGPLVDYVPQLIALSEKYQPTDGENGWPALSAALQRFEEIGVPDVEGWPTDSDAVEEVVRFSNMFVGSFDREQLKNELAYLQYIRESRVMEELDAALKAARFVRTEYVGVEEDGLIGLRLPELGRSRAIARACRAAMRVSAAESDWVGVEQAWFDLMRLSNAMSCDLFVISRLVAGSIQRASIEELALLLVELEFEESLCDTMLSRLAARPFLGPVDLGVESDRLIWHDLIQRTHTGQGNGDGMLVMDALEYFAENKRWSRRYSYGGVPVYRLLGVTKASRGETTATVDQFFDNLRRYATLSQADRRADSFDPDTFADGLPERQVFLRFLLGSFEYSRVAEAETQMKLEAARVLLGIELYEARHGQLPETLDDLVPGILDAIPMDVISERPFVYVLGDATADDPRTFLLYSVGADGVDNRGVEKGDGASMDAAAAMRSGARGEGYDYVFNRLRDPVDDEH